MSYFLQNFSEKIDSTTMYAIIIAMSLHLLIIFGISFTEGKSPASVAREVATSLVENKKENKDANFIANGAQEGGGTVKERVRLETSNVSPLTSEEVQSTEDIINQQKQIKQRLSKKSYLTTTLSWRKSDEEDDNTDDSKHSDLEEQQERVRKQIATLEAQLSQQEKDLSTQSNIKTIDTNSTTYGAISEFLENFRIHVERIANQNYPSQALAQDITGDVRLMVIIRNDGSVKAIRLLESSGFTVLDEAAKNSVRQSAPYGKFTKDMKDLVELRIIRTWRYSEGFQQLEY